MLDERIYTVDVINSSFRYIKSILDLNNDRDQIIQYISESYSLDFESSNELLKFYEEVVECEDLKIQFKAGFTLSAQSIFDDGIHYEEVFDNYNEADEYAKECRKNSLEINNNVNIWIVSLINGMECGECKYY